MLSFVLVVLVFSQSYADEGDDLVDDRILKPELKSIEFPERGWLLDLELNQRADRWENALEDSFIYRITVDPKFQLMFSKYFFFDLNMGIGASLGSVQERFGDLRANNFIFLKESALFFRTPGLLTPEKPFWMKLSIGAINQRNFLNKFDIMMSQRALPGLEQIFKYQHTYALDKSFGFDLRSFQGVPASQSLNLNFNEKESTPLYLNANLELFIKDMSPKFGYRVGFNYGVFDYSTLPSVIANESRLYGNSVSDFGPNAEFDYDFKGWYGGWRAVVSVPKFEFAPYVKIVTNSAAPDGQNQGQMAGATFRHHDKHLNTWSIHPFTFFNEKDASVASYNSSSLGHNNREGYGIHLAYNIKKRGLKFEAQYTYSDIIEENGNLQIPSHFYGLRMEYTNEL